MISYDFFDYIAKQSVFLRIKDVVSVVLLRKILEIKIVAAEGLNSVVYRVNKTVGKFTFLVTSHEICRR